MIDACADPRRPRRLDHRRRSATPTSACTSSGWAHSVEAWDADGELAGGLYGVAIGGLFAGESMFHRAPTPPRWRSSAWSSCSRRRRRRAARRAVGRPPHLASLGAVEVPRAEYLDRLAEALERPLPGGVRPLTAADAA